VPLTADVSGDSIRDIDNATGGSYSRHMARVRHALGSIALVWLTMQAAAMIGTPVALLIDAKAEAEPECVCTHGPNGMCPMHHRSAPGSNVCAIGSATTGDATLVSLVQIAGLTPAEGVIAPLLIVQPSRPGADVNPLFRSAPPDPRPPRA